jgi:hypothetical protein
MRRARRFAAVNYDAEGASFFLGHVGSVTGKNGSGKMTDHGRQTRASG